MRAFAVLNYLRVTNELIKYKTQAYGGMNGVIQANAVITDMEIDRVDIWSIVFQFTSYSYSHKQQYLHNKVRTIPCTQKAICRVQGIVRIRGVHRSSSNPNSQSMVL
jgi:hypothetical protein